MAHYIHDDKNNRIEGLSKEEIYALIDEVIATGELPTDAQEAFVTAIKSIVDGDAYKIGLCTQAEYNQLEAQGLLEANALYIITDDDSYDDIETYLNNLQTQIDELVEYGVSRVKMNLDNSEGKKYILLTDNDPTSGTNQTPNYSPLFYIEGDNNGLFIEDAFYANELYYYDSSNNTYVNVANSTYLRDLGIDSITDLSGNELTNGEITQSQLSTGIWVNFTNSKLNTDILNSPTPTPFIIKYRFVSSVTIGSTVYYNTRNVEEKFILHYGNAPINSVSYITDKSRFGIVKNELGLPIAKRFSFSSSDSNIGNSNKLEILGVYELVNG